jgi:hypothetical protein
MLLYSSISCSKAVAFLLIILTLSSQISLNTCAASIDLYLKRLEFWQLLGFNDGSLVNGKDWRLDVLLAFGKSVYTMKVGIGGQFFLTKAGREIYRRNFPDQKTTLRRGKGNR